jgi:hypothetical protein
MMDIYLDGPQEGLSVFAIGFIDLSQLQPSSTNLDIIWAR